MISQEYRKNRTSFSLAELENHRNAWVAFSADGLRVIASAPTIELVEQKLAAPGVPDQAFVLEWIPGAEDDCIVSVGAQM